MNYLFYFIHPAKFHSFRIAINNLKKKGHHVDVLIISKDIVEDLVKAEGWDYYNLFPEGRRIKWMHIYLSAGINLLITLYRLLKFMKGKKYDLIITDDLATIIGRIKGIPTIFYTDDDLRAVPESVILIASAHYVLCPEVAYMGKYDYKKIGYQGLKSLAHLHPNSFTPDESKIPNQFRSEKGIFFFIRCVSATSTHDVGKKGLSDELLKIIIEKLEKYGQIIINSERKLPADLERYAYPINKLDIAHYIYFSHIFISDSTTMCAEAAVLGIPAIEIDDWHADFEQYKLLSTKYKLLKGFYPNQGIEILGFMDEQLNDKDLKTKFSKRRNLFLNDHIDLSKFMIWLFENFPVSIGEFKNNQGIQSKFK